MTTTPPAPPEQADALPGQITITTRVNGREHRVSFPPQATVAEVVRGQLGLTGTKVSCDVQVCGACTVLVDGRPVSACTFLAYELRDRDVLTIEGLAPSPGQLHVLQQAFVDENAFQCGFCTPGMLLAAKCLLDDRPDATDEEIAEYMDGNLCRCTGYKPILAAIGRARDLLTAGAASTSSAADQTAPAQNEGR
jgi:aerobic-type carbon monoxide dehydrogenase small subunit (CoxS/CutS family)